MQDENTDIYCAASTIEAINRYMTIDYSLAIIDISLLEKEKVDMLYMMRAAKRIPILVLAERLNPDEKLLLFRAGADVCMEKPLDGSVCKAQANALIRLYQSSSKSTSRSLLAFGTDLVIDPYYRQAFAYGKQLSLTRKEFDLLHYLASYPGRVFSKEQLYHHVWQNLSDIDGNDTVKTHIKTLRKKIGSSGKDYIQNIWGIGYKFTIRSNHE